MDLLGMIASYCVSRKMPNGNPDEWTPSGDEDHRERTQKGVPRKVKVPESIAIGQGHSSVFPSSQAFLQLCSPRPSAVPSMCGWLERTEVTRVDVGLPRGSI